MKTNFPDSIELSLMEGKVGALPRLSHFFLPSQSSPFQSYVQVGSFSNAENIKSLSDKLRLLNFDFFIITEKGLTKIIVTGNLPSDQLLTDLRAKGIEGFTIEYPKHPD